MLTTIGVATAAVFGALSALHLYWAARGVEGSAAVVPERDGRPLFVPGTGATLAVAALLTTAAWLVLQRASVVPGLLPGWMVRVGSWVVAGTMVARAVGDFRHVGLFKRERDTRFARNDTRWFTPIALALGLATALVALG